MNGTRGSREVARGGAVRRLVGGKACDPPGNADAVDLSPRVHVLARYISAWTPKSKKNNGLLGYFWWLWAIILHTLGVQVGLKVVPMSLLFGPCM